MLSDDRERVVERLVLFSLLGSDADSGPRRSTTGFSSRLASGTTRKPGEARYLPYNQADPLAIGVTDNNPSPTITPGYTQLINNYHGRVGSDFTPSHNPNTRTNFAASYVTGSHAFKVGEDFGWANRGAWTGSIVPYSYIGVDDHARISWVSPCPRASACELTAARIRWPAW